MDKGKITVAVMVNYSKVFDTARYETLNTKLHRLNFSKKALHLMVSYLHNRYQHVQIDNQRYDLLPVTRGLQHGIILEPILFNIFIGDMSLNIRGNR